MKKLNLIVLFASMVAAFSSYAGKATYDLSSMEEGTRALVAKERARQMMFKSDGEKQKSDGDKKIANNNASINNASTGNTSSNGSENSSNGSKALDEKRAIVKTGTVSGGCNMKVGNSDGQAGATGGKPKPVIVTGPIIQMCK